MLPRLYVLSRADLIGNDTTKGYQAAQSAHAVAAFLLKYHSDQTWNNGWLILVSVEDEERLEYYSWKARETGLPGVVYAPQTPSLKVAEWREPDLENTLTAIAVEIRDEKQANLFKKLPLL